MCSSKSKFGGRLHEVATRNGAIATHVAPIKKSPMSSVNALAIVDSWWLTQIADHDG